MGLTKTIAFIRPSALAVLVFTLFCYLGTTAQVGINNPNPDPKAVLDVSSSSKGFIVPRISTIQREALSSNGFSKGLIVFDTDLNMLFVGYQNSSSQSKWYALQPWKTKYRNQNNAGFANMTTMTDANILHGNVGVGFDEPHDKLEVEGTIKAEEFKGNGTYPLGSILMWSGDSAPAGWAICDGDIHNGFRTPDLQSRFVVGYNPNDTRYNEPGNLSTKTGNTLSKTGGLETVRLGSNEMPSHNHSATCSSAGGHSHGFSGYEKQGSNICDNDNEISCPDTHNWSTSQSTNFAGSHFHNISVGSAGGTDAHENRPPFYTLAYIMRVY